MRVTGNVLVSLPTRPEEFLHAFATRFWNVDKDATILVVDRRLIPLGVYSLAVLNNQEGLGAILFHTCKGPFGTVGNG